MHLPHVSGADLLMDMKNDERFKDTIIIITTADARMGESYGEKADFVMIKPISFVQLRDLTSRLKPKDEQI
jgi:CheY-like chemotaxis protein